MLEAEEAAAVGVSFTPSLQAPNRCRDCVAPDGSKRLALTWAASRKEIVARHAEVAQAIGNLRVVLSD